MGSFSCDYDINANEENGIARIECKSSRYGIPYPCLLDDSGRVKWKIEGPFGSLFVDNVYAEQDGRGQCTIKGFGGSLTPVKGVENIKNLVVNAVEKAINTFHLGPVVGSKSL